MDMDNPPELMKRPTLTVIHGNRVTPENFWEKGRAMISQMYPENAPTIKLGQPECEAWVKYFEKHLGWRPWALKALQAGNIQAMTVPAQWPEWFDTSYAKGA